MNIAEATWPELADLSAETDLALLPVGSTEQHGPHAPSGTDRFAATAIAESGAEAYDESIAVAPTIPVGISEEHRHFAGTLWVSPETFRSYVRDIIESLAMHGFDRVVVVNGHGGNTDALAEACRRMTRDETAFAVPFTWFEELAADAPDIGHAGPVETAFLRHVHPSLVREDEVESAATNGANRWGQWQGQTNLAVDTVEFSENGVVGDPREGDAALGTEVVAQATDALVALLERVAQR
jgi:creatinine amidohydrolase